MLKLALTFAANVFLRRKNIIHSICQAITGGGVALPAHAKELILISKFQYNHQARHLTHSHGWHKPQSMGSYSIDFDNMTQNPK
jgi:hypothetical protein